MTWFYFFFLNLSFWYSLITEEQWLFLNKFSRGTGTELAETDSYMFAECSLYKKIRFLVCAFLPLHCSGRVWPSAELPAFLYMTRSKTLLEFPPEVPFSVCSSPVGLVPKSKTKPPVSLVQQFGYWWKQKLLFHETFPFFNVKLNPVSV